MNAQALSLRRMLAHKRQPDDRARTVAVTSGTSGAGKTTLAVNLAVARQRGGVRVLLVDAAPGRANAAALLGLSARDDLRDVVRGDRSVPDIVLDGPGGIRILPAAAGIAEFANLTPWQQEHLFAGFSELGASADLVLADTGSGPSPDVLSVLAAADEVAVALVPDPAAVTQAYALIKVLAHNNRAANVTLIPNRARDRREARALADHIATVAQRFVGVELGCLGFVLDDPHAPRAAREHQPLVEAYPWCPATRCIEAVATRLRHPSSVSPGGSLAGWARQLAAFQARGIGIEEP